MANSQNSRDLIKGALALVGELTDGTSQYQALAETFLNEVYLAVLSGGSEFEIDVGEPWIWARNPVPKSLILQPVYENGTVSLVQGNTLGTFSVPPSSSLGSFENRYIKINDRTSYYLITAHTAGASSFTLERSYIEATGATLAFQAIPVHYNLGSGILRLVEPLRVYGNTRGNAYCATDSGKIFGIGLNKLREEFPIQFIREGVPNRFASQRRNEDEWWIEVNAFPDEPTKVDFDVIEIPTALFDSEESIPIIPREYRNVLKYGTSHFLAVKKEQFEKAQYFFGLTQGKLKAMLKNDNRETTSTGRDKGRLIARQDEVNGRRLRGYY